jgi:hypothetical protein
MVKAKKQQIGSLTPLYHFSLNPYPEFRFYSCPECKNKTSQKTLPLLIMVESACTIALNITCRYCKYCDCLICHKNIIEHILFDLFENRDPSKIGNEYYIIGTVEKKVWREGLNRNLYKSEILLNLHDFKSFEELRMTVGGWLPADQPIPIMTPPPSLEWVKRP